MDDIAKGLMMSKKTLYQYFESKNDLVFKIIEAHLFEEEQILLAIQSKTEDAIQEMIQIARYIIEFTTKMNPSLSYDLKKYYPECWLLIEQGHMGFVKESITKNINRGKKEGFYRKEIITEIIASLYVSNCMNITLVQMPQGDIVPSEIFREMILYHLHGMMTEQGKQLFEKNKNQTYAKV